LALMAARAHWTMLLQRDELVASRSALQNLVSHDALTGLYNRRFMDATLPREFARSQRDNKQIVIIMLDVDHFKKVNDQYGHPAGDEVLKALAELLKKDARKSDLICRYGGEEFVAVMPDMGADQALARAESWRKQLEEMTIACADVEIHITLSAGIAVFPGHGSEPGYVIARADEMLYQAKREGRNRVCVDVVQ
jgi:diguanylate cyclase